MNCQLISTALVVAIVVGCATVHPTRAAQSADGTAGASPPTPTTLPAESVRRTAETDAAQRYAFSPEEERLLEEIQHGCFLYFWKEVGAPSGLVKDRKLGPVSSIAAVGFQLSSLPIGVERKWITRAEGEERARTVLRSLLERDDNKRYGVYLHYPDLDTGGLSRAGYEIAASTVDHALLMAGAIPAGVYFGGEVRALVDRLIAETHWRAFSVGEGGLLSMGWKPADPAQMDGEGQFIRWYWKDSGDEERLIYFLGAGAPRAEYALPPELYYRTARHLKRWEDGPPYVVTYPGALFTYTFSHCWIDYRKFDADDPARFGSDLPAVDWFENSRRAVLTHRARCIAMADTYKTFAEDRWGLSACDGPRGYMVPNVQPNLAKRDDWHQGTIAPYAAGAAIMFTPAESVAALHAFRFLKDADGRPVVWRDPAEGGYGLADAFNLELGWTSPDYLGIDHGPLLLAIENVRTGLIWRLFMEHDVAQRAVERLGWKRRATGSEASPSP
ncbi:MAG: hypothetical protein IPM18_08710 [Phycisphaerales bacterium]|nr:hypothetical protein [Phycisphaerales bacterium]